MSEPPAFDAELAARLLGARVLVGLTRVDAQERPLSREQLHGRVVSADPRTGFVVALDGERAGERLELPPDTRPFRPAQPGEYRLAGTGEVVVDPDFLSVWTVSAG